MAIYRKIENVTDIASIVFVSHDENISAIERAISGSIQSQCKHLGFEDDLLQSLSDSSPDLIFIGSTEENRHKKSIDLCLKIRGSGYGGIIILLTKRISTLEDTACITSKGFDNYLLYSDSLSRAMADIRWAILNHRRRVKLSIQFDNNPDMFYTVDREGRIFDLNLGAVGHTGYSPKEIVNRNMNVSEIGTLKKFKRTIRPLIIDKNIGKVFSITVEEGDTVSQIRTKIHNVVTMGLIATVEKTDITEAMYSNTLDIMVNSITLLSQRDNYTAAHSSRVFYYCTFIADKLGVDKNKKFMRDLYFAALLHDVGKIGVRDRILLKPGKLTREEFDHLATHPVKGYKLLHPYSFLNGSSEFVRYHHERFDGKGYPEKLKGNKIPLGSAIIAVADSFDAMTTTRPYRQPLPFEKVCSEINDNIGIQFNVEVGKAFSSIMSTSMVEKVQKMSRKPLNVISHEVISTILEA